jgi:hypothetical protein
MSDKLFGNFTLVDFLVYLFVVGVIYILAIFTSVFVRVHKEFMTPVIFGLMLGVTYGNYIWVRNLLGK